MATNLQGKGKSILAPIKCFSVGSAVEIEGRMVDSGYFDINLQSANWLEIPLHISVRPDEKCIIRNSRTAKSLFGEEERCGGMPLTMGKDFKMTIEADECGFHLWIDGQQFAVMKHRMEMQKIECLCINGKVEITSIRMRNACMKSVPKEDAA